MLVLPLLVCIGTAAEAELMSGWGINHNNVTQYNYSHNFRSKSHQE